VLNADSEVRLTNWIREHLSLAVHLFADPDFPNVLFFCVAQRSSRSAASVLVPTVAGVYRRHHLSRRPFVS